MAWDDACTGCGAGMIVYEGRDDGCSWWCPTHNERTRVAVMAPIGTGYRYAQERLDRRAERFAKLAEQGWPHASIAAWAGVSRSTVERDLLRIRRVALTADG